MSPRIRSLTDLPLDIVEIIAKSLLPYDVLHLSSTCKSLRSLFYDKSVWLHVSDAVSYSRPLPFTVNDAIMLSVSRLHHACLRAERVAKKWANPVVKPRKKECVKISFPDKRIISYFSFIPGCRHLMVYDLRNVLSCWTVDGRCLLQKKILGRTVLTRWKPLDEIESASRGLEPGQQAVEITMQTPMRPARPTRCDTMLLVYSADKAEITSTCSFTVPGSYEPFSAISQDDLYGALVIIPGLEHVGIFLTNRGTGRGICLDTGLNPEAVPQALVSCQYMVLYWESGTGAHSYMYDIEMLTAAVDRLGVEAGDTRLEVPVPLPPCEVRDMPFLTITGPSYKGKGRIGQQMYDAGHGNDTQDEAHADFPAGNNPTVTSDWDWFPFIIPKWMTLRENLRHHKIRSIMTLSRTTSEPDLIWGLEADALMGDGVDPFDQPVQPQALQPNIATNEVVQNLIALLNDPHHDFAHPNHVQAGGNGATDNFQDAAPAPEPQGPPPPLQGPQPNWVPPLPEFTHPPDYHYLPPAPLTAITHHYFDYDAFPQPSSLRRTLIAEVPLRQPQNIRLLPAFGAGWISPATVLHGIAGLNEGDEEDMPIAGIGDPGEVGNDLVEEQLRVFGSFVEDSLGGSPVLGYGGRCAIWVEEHEREGTNGATGLLRPTPVMKVATFPAFERPACDGSKGGEVYIHPELEVAQGRVCALEVPDCVTLDSAYLFDLDDIRGIVGIAMTSGEIILVDYS